MADLLIASSIPAWQELRDDAGHLYARVQRDEWLLEVRLNGRVKIFRLDDYLRKQEPEQKYCNCAKIVLG